jgi:hypothetical protein
MTIFDEDANGKPLYQKRPISQEILRERKNFDDGNLIFRYAESREIQARFERNK